MNADPPTLIEKAQKGDSQAFETLVGEYRERLERHVRARLGAHLLARGLKKLKEGFGDETESLNLPPRRLGDGDVEEEPQG